MDLALLESLQPEFEVFARQFDACIKSRPTRNHFRTYLAGQLSDLPRKSVVPIAKQAGVPARTLQEFLSLHRWDHLAMRDRLQEIVASRHAAADAIGIVAESRLPKKGDKTPGVHERPIGATGQKENCLLTVHLAYLGGIFRTLLDGDLYLPRGNWHTDAGRRRGAGIPESEVYRPRWRIGLQLLRGAVARGISLRWLFAEQEFGSSVAFRRGVARLGLQYVVETPSDTQGWLRSRPIAAADVARRAGASWSTCGDREAAALRFRPVEGRGKGKGELQWLMMTRPPGTNRISCYLSNAPASAPIESLCAIASSRPRVERLLMEAKEETGLAHYEGRSLTGLKRHLVLTAVSLLFLAGLKQRAALGAGPRLFHPVRKATEPDPATEMSGRFAPPA